MIYKIGEIVAPVIDETGFVKLQVKEIVTQEYEGGVQTVYVCRVWAQQYRNAAWLMGKDLVPFTVAELKKWKEPNKTHNKL